MIIFEWKYNPLKTMMGFMAGSSGSGGDGGSGEGGGDGGSSSSSSSPSSSSSSGKGDSGKGDTGKGDTGKGDTGKGYTSKGLSVSAFGDVGLNPGEANAFGGWNAAGTGYGGDSYSKGTARGENATPGTAEYTAYQYAKNNPAAFENYMGMAKAKGQDIGKYAADFQAQYEAAKAAGLSDNQAAAQAMKGLGVDMGKAALKGASILSGVHGATQLANLANLVGHGFLPGAASSAIQWVGKNALQGVAEVAGGFLGNKAADGMEAPEAKTSFDRAAYYNEMGRKDSENKGTTVASTYTEEASPATPTVAVTETAPAPAINESYDATEIGDIGKSEETLGDTTDETTTEESKIESTSNSVKSTGSTPSNNGSSGSLQPPARDSSGLGLGVFKEGANYDNDAWNRGMQEQSSSLVSDEQCKMFAKKAFHESTPHWSGVKKIIVEKII